MYIMPRKKKIEVKRVEPVKAVLIQDAELLERVAVYQQQEHMPSALSATLRLLHVGLQAGK